MHSVILRCTKFGINRILPSRAIVCTIQADTLDGHSLFHSICPETNLVQRDPVTSKRQVFAASNDSTLCSLMTVGFKNSYTPAFFLKPRRITSNKNSYEMQKNRSRLRIDFCYKKILETPKIIFVYRKNKSTVRRELLFSIQKPCKDSENCLLLKIKRKKS